MKFKKILYNYELAQEMGFIQAMVLHYISFWVEFNKRKKREDAKFEGVYWTYQSYEQIAFSFPGFSKKQIRLSINKLIEAGLLKSSSFSDKRHNNKPSYRLTDEGKKYSANFTYRQNMLLVDYTKNKDFIPPVPEGHDSPGSPLKAVPKRHGAPLKGVPKGYQPRAQRVSTPCPKVDDTYNEEKGIKKKVSDKEISGAVPAPGHIQKILSAFAPISVKINYGNVTNRRAAAELIDRFGFEQALFFAEKAVQIMQAKMIKKPGTEYAPTITSPSELNLKIAKLTNFITESVKQANKPKSSWDRILDG